MLIATTVILASVGAGILVAVAIIGAMASLSGLRSDYE